MTTGNKTPQVMRYAAASVAALAVSAQIQAGCERPPLTAAGAAASAQALIAFKAIATAAASTASASAASSDAIVGMWHTNYRLPDGSLYFDSFEQWHVGGLEWEGANTVPGAFCQGTWSRIGPTRIQLFHVGWNYPGFFTELQFITVSPDGMSYHGSFDLKNYDSSGNLITSGPLAEVAGTVAATRLTVNSTSANIH